MTTLNSTTNGNDFYTQLTVEIEAGNLDQAAAMVMALEKRKLKVEILSRLAGSIDHALDIRGADTLDLDRARALARARDRATELMTSLDVDHAQALELAIDRARTLYLYLDRAEQINKVLITCLTQLGDLDKSHSALTVRVRKSTPEQAKRSRARMIIITLFCILILVGILALMAVQSKSKGDAAATTTFVTQQTDNSATPNK